MSVSRSRRRLFLLVCVACVAGAAVYMGYAGMRARALSGRPPDHEVRTIDALGEVPEHRLFFRSTALDSTYGRLAVVPADAPEEPPVLTELTCDRVAVGGDRGVCLTQDWTSVHPYQALVFDDALTVQHALDLAGGPSRVRVSPDGTLAGITVFVSGHSYAGGNFSTQTTIVDLVEGQMLADLEDFSVERDGEAFDAVDFNFWGVTFTEDSNRFYATLASGGSTYLIEGDVRARTARVLTDNVECPSLSPDGTHIVFKKRMNTTGLAVWQFHVLDLATMEETPLTELRSIDDQVAWLDDSHVTYAAQDPAADSPAELTTWVMPIDGGAPPAELLARSDSLIPAG